MFPLFSRERNKIYAEICNAKIGSEYFEDKMVQTISGAAKTKEVQCEAITTAEKGKPGRKGIFYFCLLLPLPEL